MVAASGTEYRNYEYDERTYIWIISALDGHYITEVTEMRHGDPGNGEYIVESAGMYFDPYGIVYNAHSYIGNKGVATDDGT